MTQFQLAERAGLSEVYIGYLEQGKRRAALDTYIRIVNVLGYTLDDLTSDYLTNRDMFSMDLKALLEEVWNDAPQVSGRKPSGTVDETDSEREADGTFAGD